MAELEESEAPQEPSCSLDSECDREGSFMEAVETVSRSQIETYIIAGVSIAMTIYNTWQFAALGIFVVFLMICDVIYRSHPYIRKTPWLKVLLLFLATFVWISSTTAVYWRNLQAGMHVKVIFKEPQFLPLWKRIQIEMLVNECHDKLNALGIPVSSDVPAISGDRRDGPVFNDGMSFSGPPYSWHQAFSMDSRAKPHAKAVAMGYLWFAIDEYYGDLDLAMRHEQYTPAYAAYFDCSFWGYTEDCQHGLSHGLMEVRKRYGAAFTDQMVAYSIRAMHDAPPPKDLPPHSLDPNSYLKVACKAIANDCDERINVLNAALKAEGESLQ